MAYRAFKRGHSGLGVYIWHGGSCWVRERESDGGLNVRE